MSAASITTHSEAPPQYDYYQPQGRRPLTNLTGQVSGSGGDDHTIKLWETATGALTRTFEGHSSYVTSVAFSPDGARVLSGSGDKTIKLWDVATGTLIRTFEGHSGRRFGGVLPRWRPRAIEPVPVFCTGR